MTHANVATYAVRLGDDALILGQRLIEWTSNAPLLEEELALANTALDYLGRARLYFQGAGAITGQTEDEIAFSRDVRAFGNLLICELPRGDFAFTMARQFLIDAFQLPFLEALSASRDSMLSAIAAKAVKESRYHLARSHNWVLRLGDGTDDSHARIQRAFDTLSGYTDEFFEMDQLEGDLACDGIAVDRATLRPVWDACVTATLGETTLVRGPGTWRVNGGRRGVHTEHLGHLLSELQFVQRAYPRLEW